MDSRDQRNAVSHIVAILRRITNIIRWFPFVYLGVYSILLLTETAATEQILCIEDSFFSISPVITAGFIVFSHLLNMCKWHKIACLLPSTTDITNCVDCYIFQFTQIEVVLINILAAVVSLLFLMFSHRHFFSRGC